MIDFSVTRHENNAEFKLLITNTKLIRRQDLSEERKRGY